VVKDTDEVQASGHENIRRVYALPAEMVERITKFQREKGLGSEVEAVRRLLDEALKSRDTLETLLNQMLAKLGQTKIITEAARDVLAGHPLVTTLKFGDAAVYFQLKDGASAEVTETGQVSTEVKKFNWVYRDVDNPFAGGEFEAEPPF
jgi:hypothetical protein